MWFRHFLSIAILPFTVIVLVPLWIARRTGVVPRVGDGLFESGLQLLGLVLLAVGLAFFVSSLRRFAVDGRGTLAPWDPPRQLVVRGPYRYVRNPMISGVILILCGEALVLLSWRHAAWALIFFAANVTWIPLFEEPQLAHRFGDRYREYCQHVPRVIPRLTPWAPDTRAQV